MAVATQNTVEMAVSASPSALDVALKAVKPVASAKSAVQALSGVLLTADNSGLHLTATDMETSVRRRVLDTLVYGEMDEVVSASMLAQAVKALAKCETITFTPDRENNEVMVKGGKRTIRLRTLRREDFPPLPFGAERYSHPVFTAEAADFKSVISRAIPFASGDDTRPILTGVCIDTDAIVSTDSYRLTVLSPKFALSLPKRTGEYVKLNLPAKALKNVLRNVKDGNVTLTVDPDDMRHVTIDNAGREQWLLRTIDGQYPNYRQLIPEDTAWEASVRMPTANLKSAAQLAAQFLQRNAPLRLGVNGKVTVSGHTPDVCSIEEVIENAEISYSHRAKPGSWSESYQGEMEVGFNPDFMLDIAKTVLGEHCTLRLITPLRPGLIEDGEDKFLLMPIRLNV